MRVLKKIWDKIILEIRCYRADNTAFRRLNCVTCFEKYPPSFYIRYSPEEQKAIKERDRKEIKKMIDNMD